MFSDPGRATRQIKLLYEAFVASGSPSSLEQFAGVLEALLSSSPDPDMALNAFLRFSESTPSKAAFFDDLVKYPVVADLFGKLAGHSLYFADILVRDPSLFRWLSASDVLLKPVQREDLLSETERLRKMFRRPERRLDAIKRLQRRETLRIGSRDLLGLADLASTTGQLSDLADVLLEEVLALSAEQLSARFLPPLGARFAVIALGKLGGRELNYSSDIDLLFIYGGKLRRTRERWDPHEYYNRLGERLVQNLSQPSAEGYLYRVDLRLRPESGAGPIARPLESTLLYYEAMGEVWERQMLIKGRPVAGDLAFGREFLQQLEPFVYPRTFLLHPAESIARIKARIEASIGEEENVKVMAGGIRDIEFIAQTLQLLNGGSQPALREGNTLAALCALERARYLSKRESEDLREAYAFFRELEHRLQILLNTQTHTLPKASRALDAMAGRMGLAHGGALHDAIARHRETVRGIYDRVLAGPRGDSSEGILSVLDGGADEATLHSSLRSFGFRQTHLALRNLKQLTGASILRGTRGLDARTREAFRRSATELFREIAATPDPDQTLNGVTMLLCSRSGAAPYHGLLETEGFRRLLLDLSKGGPRLLRSLAADPLFLETIIADPSLLRGAPAVRPPQRGRLIPYKQREELHAGLRHVLGYSEFDMLTEDLSRVADQIIDCALKGVGRAAKVDRKDLAVFALGKYGTRELLYDADLDLLFIAATGIRKKSRAEDATAEVLRQVTAASAEGRLYTADVRLRPEGKNAPLLVTLESYRSYLETRASLWERQALTRLRFVAGGAALGKGLLEQVREYIYRSPLPDGWVREIVAMRLKMEGRSRWRSDAPVDVKLGPGGMVDIEFLAQMVQLHSGARLPELHGMRTREVLAAAPRKIFSTEESGRLRGAYQLFREVEKQMRITLEEGGSLLPEGEKLESVARSMGFAGGSSLAEEVQETMSETRRMFLELSSRMEP